MAKKYVKNSNIHCSVVANRHLSRDLKECDMNSESIISRDICYSKAAKRNEKRRKACVES